MTSTDSLLPTSMDIRHKFFTFSVHLTMRSKNGVDLFVIECPSLTLRKIVQIRSAETDSRPIVWLSNMGGPSDDIVINGPNDEILGIMKRELEFVTGMTTWIILDAKGNELIATQPIGSRFGMFFKKISLFSSREEWLMAGNHQLGSFVSRSGVLHDHFEVDLRTLPGEPIDRRILLATLTVLTGVFYRVFM